MPGDPLKKVQSGQPLQFPAAAYNAFIDTVAAFKAQQHPQSGTPKPRPPLPPGLCYAKNGSGGNVDQFAVLGLSSALIAPTDSPEGFAENVGFSGVTPTSDHVGNGLFAILLEPAAVDAVALACIAGATVCKVNVGDAGHGFAGAEIGTSTALVSAPAGPVQILWKESGTGSGKWAIVRFGVLTGFFPVDVTQVGGTAGDQTNPPDFTYDVALPDGGLTIGSALSPVWARNNGKVVAATKGTARYTAAGDLELYQVDEVRDTAGC